MDGTTPGRRAILAAAPCALAALAGCAGGPDVRAADTSLPIPADSPTIHVVARDWHTDVGLPVTEIARTPLGIALSHMFPDARHLLFGFGERGFFTAPAPGSGEFLAAIFPGPGAILATPLPQPPAEAFAVSRVVALRVHREGVAALARFIWDDIEKDAGGLPRVITHGPYPGSMFFASTATYTLAYTCNTWTATALRAAGLPVSPSGVLTVGQLMDRARRAAERQAEARATG